MRVQYSLDLTLHNVVDWAEKMLTRFHLVQNVIGKKCRVGVLMPL